MMEGEKFEFDSTTENASYELESFFSYNGIIYRKVGGEYQFLFSSRGCKWKTVCRVHRRVVLIYGIYPFQATNSERADMACGEVNRRLLHGAMFRENDTLVFRTDADIGDGWGAYDVILQAMEYNASVMTAFWQRFSLC